MSIFDIDYINVVWQLLVPPDKRLPKWLAWGSAVMQGKQWKGDTYFNGYMQGVQYLDSPLFPALNAYSTTTSYNPGDRVIYLIQSGGNYYGDNAVYECLSACTGNAPTGTNVVPNVTPAYVVDSTTALRWLSTGNNAGPFYWVKVCNNFIGANERASYSCQKSVYEYALNKWFNTTYRQPNGIAESPIHNAAGTPDIYITNNTISTDNFYFSSVKTGAGFFLPATNSSDTTKTLSQYFFPSNVFTQQYDFSINIPVAEYNALDNETTVTAGHNTPGRDGIVSAFANLLCPAGAHYNIITY